jgi:hypothetical protein
MTRTEVACVGSAQPCSRWLTVAARLLTGDAHFSCWLGVPGTAARIIVFLLDSCTDAFVMR